MDEDVLVVGAGPAGLAVAACLRRRGVDVLVVDRGGAVGDSRGVSATTGCTCTPRACSPPCPGCGCRAGSAAGWPRTTSPAT
ncbi:FAD-dependent oxidoreductase [Blastococcus sp. CT_GayMR16]|nr:FAD-dependent oxidoreductase [Blastococcus sp. CT_GayMR16]